MAYVPISFSNNLPQKSLPAIDGFLDLENINNNIVIRQDPLGNVLVVISDGLTMNASTEQSTTRRIADEYVSVVFPIAKGISVIRNGEMIIMIRDINNTIIHHTRTRYNDGVFPVFTSSELKDNDIPTILDSIDLVTVGIANKVCENIKREFEKVKDVSSVKVMGLIELSTSLSLIYRESLVQLYQNKQPINNMRSEMSKLNNIDNNFFRLSSALTEVNQMLYAIQIQLTDMNK